LKLFRVEKITFILAETLAAQL